MQTQPINGAPGRRWKAAAPGSSRSRDGGRMSPRGRRNGRYPGPPDATTRARPAGATSSATSRPRLYVEEPRGMVVNANTNATGALPRHRWVRLHRLAPRRCDRGGGSPRPRPRRPLHRHAPLAAAGVELVVGDVRDRAVARSRRATSRAASTSPPWPRSSPATRLGWSVTAPTCRPPSVIRGRLRRLRPTLPSRLRLLGRCLRRRPGAAAPRGAAGAPALALRGRQGGRRAARPGRRGGAGARRHRPALLQRLRPAAAGRQPLFGRHLGFAERVGAARRCSSTATAGRAATSSMSATSSGRW